MSAVRMRTGKREPVDAKNAPLCLDVPQSETPVSLFPHGFLVVSADVGVLVDHVTFVGSCHQANAVVPAG